MWEKGSSAALTLRRSGRYESQSLFSSVTQALEPMRAFLVLLLSLTCSLPAWAQSSQALAPKTLLGGTVEVLVPVGFAPMGEELLRVKYPRAQRPTLVYSDPSGAVNLALNHTANPLQPSQLAEVHQAMEATFKRMYPSAAWFQSGLVTIYGRRFFLLDFRTPALDTDVRNMMMGTAVQGRLLLVSFNVTKEREAHWLTAAKKILYSIKINE